MSEFGIPAQLASAKSVTHKAAAWVERKARGDWNESDQLALDAWLLESSANEIAYWRVEAAWNETYRLAAVRTASPMGPKQSSSRKIWPLISRGFVAATVAATVAVMATSHFNNEGARYVTRLGERKILTFSDGSQIELNTQTVLRAAYEKSSRKVWLEKGEAYFRIKHDATRPFAVIAAGRQITDLGTEFSVKRNNGRLQIAVLEGSVRLEGNKTTPHAELTSGEMAIADANALTLSRLPVQDLDSKLSWRSGKLVFHHTPLSEAANEFNRYNTGKLIVVGKEAGAITINGTFATDDTKAFARLAKVVLGLRIEDHGSTVVISY